MVITVMITVILTVMVIILVTIIIIVVNAKKRVNGQSVSRVLLLEYVSYSLHVGKVIRSQVSPKSSHNKLSAKEKVVREIGELFLDLALMLKSDRETIEVQLMDLRYNQGTRDKSREHLEFKELREKKCFTLKCEL